MKDFKTRAVLSLISAVLLSACGNLSGAGVSYVPSESYPRAATSNLSAEDSYQCPDQPNVTPDYDWSFNGTGVYTVCKNPDDRARILIHGNTRSSNVICVFPVDVVDDAHIYTKPDLNTGLPLAQCYEAGSSGVYAKFDDLLNFNAVFIVEKPDLAQMQNCLVGGNYYACPQNYAFGKFR